MVLTIEESETPMNELGESIKLTKNTKGYNWEIRLRCVDKEKLDSKIILRLENLNNEMLVKFGEKDGKQI